MARTPRKPAGNTVSAPRKPAKVRLKRTETSIDTEDRLAAESFARARTQARAREERARTEEAQRESNQLIQEENERLEEKIQEVEFSGLLFLVSKIVLIMGFLFVFQWLVVPPVFNLRIDGAPLIAMGIRAATIILAILAGWKAYQSSLETRRKADNLRKMIKPLNFG